jgi:hypothetical protein
MRTAVIVAVLLALTSWPSPASASDGSVWLDLPGTTLAPDSGASWRDLTDRLCAVDTGRERTTASITLLRTGASWRIRSPAGVTRRCTGNLAIPEDAVARLAVCARLPSGPICHRTRVHT